MAKRIGADEQNLWERWWWAWYVAYFVLLVVATSGALLDDATPRRARLPIVALSVLFAAGCWVSAACWVPREQRFGPRVARLIALLAGEIALWFVLVHLSPAFYLLLFVLYPQVYSHLRLAWAAPLAVLLAALTALRQLEGTRWTAGQVDGTLLSLTLTTLAGLAFAWWLSRIIGQSAERQRLIGELRSTRAELAAAEHEAGRSAERQRLAREIHDTLAQGFISIVVQLQAADAALPRGADEASRHLEQARRTARENLAEARHLVWGGMPQPLAGATLGGALQRLCDRLAEESGVAAGVTVTGAPAPLPREAEVTLVRVAQEALANARKHAHAARVALTLSYMGDVVVLDVHDDGVGFDPAAAARSGGPAGGGGDGGGFGLRAMRERVSRSGGTLEVESAPGKGTTVAVALPAPRPCAPDGPEAGR